MTRMKLPNRFGMIAAGALALGLGGAVLYAQIEGDRGIAPIASNGDFEVTGIEVNTTGKNADEARSAGWREAQRKAWEKLWSTNGLGGGAAPALDDGTIEPRLRLIRPTEASTVPAKIMEDTNWLEADRAAFTAVWTAELAEVPEFTETTLHIVAGLLLPIWKQLPQDETRVYRLQTDDGQRIVGRRVSPAWVATTLADDAPKLSAAQVHALVLEGKTVVRLAEGMELHRSRVMGVNR
ncbi:MAG: hypothetical protein RIS94_3084, partial [Pseudomonadota bacterium]